MLLPTQLRKAVLYHLVYVMIVPIVRVYRTFAQRRMTNNFYATYDSSYGNIARMLNILFPSEVGTITVTPATTTDVELDKMYITTDKSTAGSIFIGECYIDKSKTQKLFNVTLPSDLKSNTQKKKQIDTIVSMYALPGYGYNIL